MTKTINSPVNSVLNTIALTVRIISIPPVMALLMSVAVFLSADLPIIDLIVLTAFLSVVPVLAYPLQPLIPGFRGKGREGQRKLAFIFTGIGYAAGCLCVYLLNCHELTKEIFLSYFISCLILTLVNKLTAIHASGHAAAVTGALIFPMLYCSFALVPVCLVAYTLILMSSIGLKRHTLKEFLLGSGVCFAGYVIALTILHLLTNA